MSSPSFCFATCLFSSPPPPLSPKSALSDLSPEAIGEQPAPTTQGATWCCHLLDDNEEAVWHLCLEPGCPGSPGLFCPAGARWGPIPLPLVFLFHIQSSRQGLWGWERLTDDSKQRNSLSSSGYMAGELVGFPGLAPLSSVLFLLPLRLRLLSFPTELLLRAAGSAHKGQRGAQVSEGDTRLGGNRSTAQPFMADVCPTPRRPEKHATSPVSTGAGRSDFRAGLRPF